MVPQQYGLMVYRWWVLALQGIQQTKAIVCGQNRCLV